MAIYKQFIISSMHELVYCHSYLSCSYLILCCLCRNECRSLHSKMQGRPRRGSEHHVRDHRPRKQGQARRQQQCTRHRVRIRRMPRARRSSVRTGSCTHVRASGSGELLLDLAMPPYCIILTCCIVYICGRIPCHVHRACTRAYKRDLRRGQPQPRRSCLGRALPLLPWLPCIRRRLGCWPRPNPTPSHRKQHRPPRPNGLALNIGTSRPNGCPGVPVHAGACTGRT